MKKKQTAEDRIIELVEELDGELDALSMDRDERDRIDFIISDIKETLENGI